jgi:hypothetical protein
MDMYSEYLVVAEVVVVDVVLVVVGTQIHVVVVEQLL